MTKSKEEHKQEHKQEKIINKGTGAGGSNTNYYGKILKKKTNNEKRLLNLKYTKNFFYK